uniref:PHP domain protein n=1 Tax=Cyanothece sp. (strain PCC 7425 / ATCC 29141) TaxID=395961 RepID=B8HWZ2_CYAP4
MTITHPISRESSAALRTVFTRIDAESCPYHYNFHLHTIYSDGRLAPLELMQQAIDHGLQGLAITDHHTAKGYQIARHWLTQKQQEQPEQPIPTLWSGVEISAGLLDAEVHILGYGFEVSHPALVPYLQGYTPMDENYRASNVIQALQAAGGIAILAHPMRYKRSAEQLIPAIAALGIDGVETYYCYTNPKPWHPSPEATKIVGDLARSFGLLETCGTDTHGLDILQRL